MESSAEIHNSCQSHSSLANLVRAKGLEPSFPDMTGEYQRVVEEAQPAWFLRENVPRAPDVKPLGYDVRSFLIDNSTLDSGDGTGNEQMRTRRFWFGVRDGECPELRRWIDFALYELPDDEKQGPPCGHDATPGQRDRIKKARARQAAVTGRHEGRVGTPDIDYSPPRRSLEEMLRLQGLPPGWIGHQPWTVQAMRKMLGNGVAVPTGRALAKAIATWLEQCND